MYKWMTFVSLLGLLLSAPLAAQAQEGTPAEQTPSEKTSANETPATRSLFGNPTGYKWGVAVYPDVDAALDPEKSEIFRLRMIDEIGRYGDKDMRSRLQSALGDESPEIRIATIRALMRLGMDSSRPELYGLLKNAESTPRERAWAARALAKSSDSKETVPELISALGSHDGKPPADGEQAAIMAALRKLTGQSLGARPKTLLTSFVGDDSIPSLSAYRQQWSEWWEENKGLDPEQWRLNALGSEIPKDRASAARLLADKGDFSAIPKLLSAFRLEGLEGGKSGVREAIAESLQKLTGIKPEYSPFKTDEQDQAVWEDSHRAAYRAWEDFNRAVKEEGKNPYLLKFAAKEPRTRADALRSLDFDARSKAPTREIVKLLADPSAQVGNEAWKTLVRTTGLSFPFDADGETALKAIQIGRWDDWAREFENAEDSVRLLSIFEETKDMKWGARAAALNAEAAAAAQAEFEDSLVSMRSRALSFISRNQIKVVATSLIRNFEDELRVCQRALRQGSTLDLPIYSLLQKNYIHALAKTGDYRVPPLIIQRLRIADEAAREGQDLAALNDPDLVRTCVFCLGEIGDLPTAVDLLRDHTLPLHEPRYRVRGQAARALGRCGDGQEVLHLTAILEDESEQIFVRLGAIDGLSAIAQRFSVEHAKVSGILRNLWQADKKYDARYPLELRRAAERSVNFLNRAPNG